MLPKNVKYVHHEAKEKTAKVNFSLSDQDPLKLASLIEAQILSDLEQNTSVFLETDLSKGK